MKLLCIVTAFLGYFFLPAVQAASSERPNFILIFCDDLGFGDLASYGHPYAETPNLDRLASQGTSFRQFHVNGNVCPVTRAGLMTSRNPSWFPNYTGDYGFLGQTTVTNVLQDAGYLTAHVGKWNIGSDPDAEAVDYGIDYLKITGSVDQDPRGKEGLRFDEAIAFLEQHHHQQHPFYLNLWLYTTHVPIEPPQSFLDHFQNLTIETSRFGEHMQTKLQEITNQGGDINESMRIYLAEVLALDTQVGRLLDKLDQLGLTDTTVVAFSSDNGPERIKQGWEAVGYAGGLRGEKHSYYEGGTRVPLIVRWPGHVPAGRVDDESILFGLDWLPTVATLAGADVPWDVVEGEDMSDVWKGNTRSRTNPLFFRQWKEDSHDQVYVRYGRWKLLKKEQELYDLFRDPQERVNLFNTRRDVYAALQFAIAGWEATLPTGHARFPEGPLPFDPNRMVVHLTPPSIDGAFNDTSTCRSKTPMITDDDCDETTFVNDVDPLISSDKVSSTSAAHITTGLLLMLTISYVSAVVCTI